MVQSMTGFASAQGADAHAAWAWEIRSVNGKGVDVRLRLPDWIEGLEPDVRAAFQGRIARGSVTVSLKVTTKEGSGAATLDPEALDAVLDAMARIEAEAMARGISLAPSTAAEIVGLRGMLTSGQEAPDTATLREAVMADLPPLVEAFVAMRAEEGAAIAALLDAQLAEIAALVETARAAAIAREGEQRERLRQQLERVTQNADGADPDRVAQELALIVVKSDITEEIDRLTAHVDAARRLLAEDGPVGRKLDFLMQEFNREANTLCSKAGSAPLTEAGLGLKTVIDRMREQVQNVE
ncbi:YicC/YloC family endoribonuclease [Roseivivax sediminis]|uniref:TIGR00255 family protein n=1 Tax=Roseivivax sediminis TaxID=936889 RepID=A0A1I1WV24_9RHOB|nr:YicC/YloC family endoribonuclease [Roseivivax sediminis]SFD98966.1 TIGR00255 family protein [Roseivivax sediminis]